MNKFKLYFILFFISVSLFSCKHDDDVTVAPPRDCHVQKLADLDSIRDYLKTHSLQKVEVDGLTDVVITDLVPGGVSIWDNTQYPLDSLMVKNDVRVTNLTDGPSTDEEIYPLYYVVLNEGGGASTTTTDSTFVSYRGWTLTDNAQFDRNDVPFWATYPAVTTAEVTLISGFRQFTTVLKAASSYTSHDDGTFTFVDAGVGVVFIPSGLGYFNVSRTGIPAYSPIAFTIRLDRVRERDHDQDGILTKYEDMDANGVADGDPFNNDTDGDLISHFLDMDDDGDSFLTKFEIRTNQADENSPLYPFADIPNCTGGKKLHLDKNCHSSN
ncbi:hypothetical protein [Flavobacterium sp. 3HN19-14]|uniref:hypothetical protein n=1 Tax=Flavobacterium sp. 3HN19-14 TaxID=3448133 RepID=UPI003EE1874A